MGARLGDPGRRAIPLQVAVTIVALSASFVHLAWPALKVDGVILGLLAIAVLPWLGSLFQSLELPGIGKVTYRDIEMKLADTRAELQVTKGEVASTRNHVDFAASTGVAGVRNGSPTQELRELIQRYNDIRAGSKSGPQRTQAMTDIVRHITLLADRLEEYDWRGSLRSDNGGERIAAYAYLYARPTGVSVEPLTFTLTRIEDTPFGQYWAIMALAKSLSSTTADTRDVAFQLGRVLKNLPESSGRYYELSRVIASLANENHGDAAG